jgi:hypothetical protein
LAGFIVGQFRPVGESSLRVREGSLRVGALAGRIKLPGEIMAFINKGPNNPAKQQLTPAAPVGTGDPELDMLSEVQSLKQKEAEEKAAIAAAVHDPSKRYFIQREIRVDQHNIRRYRIELTPSMCQIRGCNFDAAVECGYKNGWKEAELDQILPNGRTVQQVIMKRLEFHKENGHLVETSHIMSEDELNIYKRAASVPKGFLTSV